MKVLIITYYWPPAGGSGVQRWLSFVKYMNQMGVNLVVYTAKKEVYTVKDYSLEEQVPSRVKLLRTHIWEPYKLSSIFTGKNSKKDSVGFLGSETSFLDKIAHFIRANLFIPDARMFWIEPSVRYLKKYLRYNPVDVIITTGPPHSVHCIGLNLKKSLNIKWLADFRDPWTKIDYYHKLPLTKFADKKHHTLEKQVYKYADLIVVVGNHMKTIYDEFSDKIHVLTNGFDRDDLLQIELDELFSITHVGSINEDRNPKSLWVALRELCRDLMFRRRLKIQLIGKVDDTVFKSLEEYGLTPFVHHIDYVPYNKVAKYQFSSQVLLLAINDVPFAKGIITGKIFEYLTTSRPVLAIGPTDGDLAKILKQTQGGEVCDFNDNKKVEKVLQSYFNDYMEGKLKSNVKDINVFHRKNITKELVKILNDLLKEK